MNENLHILHNAKASRQGFGELKTEQLGGHSQEHQRHRQAPID